jgi:hypothetical protein
VSLGGDDLNIFQSNPPKVGSYKLGGFLHVRFVFGESANARDAKKVFEFVEKSCLIATSVADCRRGHRKSSFPNRSVYIGQEGTKAAPTPLGFFCLAVAMTLTSVGNEGD